MKTKQIFFTSPGIAELMEKELPPVGPGDVLVKTEYTAISGGTERACLMGVPNTQGTYPISLGYSGVSEVIKTGSGVKDFEPGDRVLVYHGHHADCRALIKLIAGKRLKVAPVITDIFSPSEAPAVYKRLAERKDFPAGAAFRWS